MMRPKSLEDYVGQESVVGQGSVWRKLIDRDTIPSMILWGPPGCGKTSLANIIAQKCKANKVRCAVALKHLVIVMAEVH